MPPQDTEQARWFAAEVHAHDGQLRAYLRGSYPAVRDIDDVVQANLKAMNAKTSGVFNVGSGVAASFNQIAEQLNRVLKTDLQPDYFENPYAFFQTWTEADLSHSRRGIGYDPQFDLRRGVDAYAQSGQLGAD